jgi:hypothetical protein
MGKLFLVLSLPVFVLACTENKGKSGQLVDSETKIVELEFLDVIDFLELDIVGEITLETTEESLIGEISKLIFHGDSIYVLDSRYGRKIYCFSLEGKFLFSFGKVGEAGDEYEAPTDFVILDDKIVLIDDESFSKLTYNLQGNFISKERITRAIREIEVDQSENMIGFIPTDFVIGEPLETYSTHTIQVLEPNLSKELMGWLPYQSGIDSFFPNQLSSTSSVTRYVHPIYGFILSLNDDLEATQSYQIDFGEYSWPISWEQFVADPEEAERLFFEGGIMTMCHNLLEDDDFIYLNALTHEAAHTPRKLDGTETKWLLLIDKKSGEGYAAPQIVAEDLPAGYQFPIARTEDAFVSLIIDDQENFEEVKNPTLLVHQFRKNEE